MDDLINLDKQTGTLTIGFLTIGKDSTQESILKLQDRYEVTVFSEHGKWKAYRAYRIENRYTVVAWFENDGIKFLQLITADEVFNSYSLLDEQLAVLKTDLKKWGKVGKYDWGEIRLSKDAKAGFSSIVILYDHR